MMARFRNFYNAKKKSQRLGLKRRSAFRTGAKIYISKKIFWGYGHFKHEIRFKCDVRVLTSIYMYVFLLNRDIGRRAWPSGRALDLQSGVPGFKSSSLPLDGFVLGGTDFNSSTP